jgi:Flp pilus assembly protein CpaB
VLTAVVAVLLALVAGILTWTYLSDADERARDDAELVDALVAREEIPKGTSGSQAKEDDLFTEEQVPRSAVPESALRTANNIDNLVAAYTVAPGQFIVRNTFVQPTQVSGFSGVLEEDMQAISINVDDTRGVAGFVAPNDVVSMILTLEIGRLDESPQGAQPVTTSAFLLPGLKVLAVGDTTATSTNAEGETREVSSGLITLEVTPRQALQIAQAAQSGTMYLTLNPPDFDPDTFQTPEEIVEAVNLFDQPLTKVLEVQQQLLAGG